MNAGINVLCYKSKTLTNGAHPLMIRVCKDGKKKYVSLGISILPHFWDFEKNRPKRNCPNKIQIENLIADKTREYNERVIEFKSESKDFTVTTLIEKVNKQVVKLTVGELFIQHVKNLKKQKRTGYAMTFLELYNSLIKFNKHLDIYFSDIDIKWLRKYEKWLRSKGSAENTIGKRLRTLRAIYNTAIEEKIVKSEYYPFKSYKVSKLHQSTAKRAIHKDHIKAILDYDLSNADYYTRLSVDLFAFTYYAGGINFVDIASLTTDNIMDGRLVYTRKKTGKLIRLPLQPQAQHLIEKYSDPNNVYLFPILNAYHDTEQKKRNRIHKVITKVNARLKEIGIALGVPIDLTTYVARHSYATVLKRAGVSTSIICESLGHSSEKVTQYYLDSFENSQIDEAMKNLL